MGGGEPGRARRRGRGGAGLGETHENAGEIMGGGGEEPVEGLLGVEPGKAGEGGLRPARRRSGREDEQVAAADLEVMIADEGCGREAEGTAGGLLRGEGGKLTRARP